MSVKKGLGKGLGALFSIYDDNEDVDAKREIVPAKIVSVPETDGVAQISIENIYPNPNQPRKNFDQTALQELASSIKVHGIIQPLVVNKDIDGRYMIIAGERRYRAGKIAGLAKLPCIIKAYTEKQIKEISLIENLQREDLNPIEAARAIKQLMEDYGFTQEVVAERIGKSRPAIANNLRLLTLPMQIVKYIEEGRLSAGHAKCLVTLDTDAEKIRFANASLDNRISVRQLEKLVKKGDKARISTTKEEQSLELKELVAEMQRVFATKVSLLGNDRKGRIYIDYYSADDLDRIVELIDLIKKKQLTLKELSNFNKKK